MARFHSKSPTREELTDLQRTVDLLADFVQRLTHAVDALTEEIHWRNNYTHSSAHSPTVTRLTSMPADPAAKDWQLNRFDGRDPATDSPPFKSPSITLFP